MCYSSLWKVPKQKNSILAPSVDKHLVNSLLSILMTTTIKHKDVVPLGITG